MDEIEGEEVSQVLEVDGDPSLGTIYSIRQYHATPGGPTSKDSIDCVFNYQLRVLKELIRLKCDAIFLEECAGPYCYKDRVLAGLKRFNVFDKNYMASLNEAEKRIIFTLFKDMVYKLGAAPFYFFFNSDAKFHGTKTEREGQIADDYLDYILMTGSTGVTETDEFKRMQYKREEWAIREMMFFFEKNRGSVAVLLYGSYHEFCQELEEYSPRPRLYTIDFPGYLKKAERICNPKGKKSKYERQCSSGSKY